MKQKIVVAGSLGRITLPLIRLLQNTPDVDVTVFSSTVSRKKDIESFGDNFHIAVGNLEDSKFLTQVPKGVEVFYSMVPPGKRLDPDFDNLKFFLSVGEAFLAAILVNAGTIKKVVNLSTVGAHMQSGNGILQGSTAIEALFKKGLKDTNVEVTNLRPVAFYYNLLNFLPVIKQAGLMAANYGGKDVMYWVSPIDIASVAYDELVKQRGSKYKIRYIVSEKKTCEEVAKIIGKEIGIKDLKWVVISDEEMLQSFLNVGFNRAFAEMMVELQQIMHNSKIYEDLLKPGNMPVFGINKLEDYVADEFKKAYFS